VDEGGDPVGCLLRFQVDLDLDAVACGRDGAGEDRSLAGPVAPDLDPSVREIHLKHSPVPDELGEQSKPDRDEQVIQRAGVFVLAPQVGGSSL
jgi:hypothetical protein